MLLDDLAECERERAQSFVRHGRDVEHAEAARLELGTHEIGEVARLRHVDLVQSDELRALQQRRLPFGHLVRREFGQDDVEIGDRITARLERRAVEHVQQRGTALHVAEELESETAPLARTLDEARNVGDGVA